MIGWQNIPAISFVNQYQRWFPALNAGCYNFFSILDWLIWIWAPIMIGHSEKGVNQLFFLFNAR